MKKIYFYFLTLDTKCVFVCEFFGKKIIFLTENSIFIYLDNFF